MSFVPTSTTIIDPWTRILGALEKKVNRQSFNTFLKPTRMSHLNGRVLFVRIPSTDFQHIGDRYEDLIQEAIDKLELEIDDVQFVTLENDPSVPQRPREPREFKPRGKPHGERGPKFDDAPSFGKKKKHKGKPGHAEPSVTPWAVKGAPGKKPKKKKHRG